MVVLTNIKAKNDGKRFIIYGNELLIQTTYLMKQINEKERTENLTWKLILNIYFTSGLQKTLGKILHRNKNNFSSFNKNQELSFSKIQVVKK